MINKESTHNLFKVILSFKIIFFISISLSIDNLMIFITLTSVCQTGVPAQADSSRSLVVYNDDDLSYLNNLIQAWFERQWLNQIV